MDLAAFRDGCAGLPWLPGNHQDRAGRSAHHPVGCRAQHQAVKSAPAVGSHNDQFDVPRLRNYAYFRSPDRRIVFVEPSTRRVVLIMNE